MLAQGDRAVLQYGDGKELFTYTPTEGMALLCSSEYEIARFFFRGDRVWYIWKEDSRTYISDILFDGADQSEPVKVSGDYSEVWVLTYSEAIMLEKALESRSIEIDMKTVLADYYRLVKISSAPYNEIPNIYVYEDRIYIW